MVWKPGEKETVFWTDTVLDLASYDPNPTACNSETHLDVTTTGIPTIKFLLQLSRRLQYRTVACRTHRPRLRLAMRSNWWNQISDCNTFTSWNKLTNFFVHPIHLKIYNFNVKYWFWNLFLFSHWNISILIFLTYKLAIQNGLFGPESGSWWKS
jgi:hypothetical protein